VQLDELRADLAGSFDLADVGVDEQADLGAAARDERHDRAEAPRFAHDIEPAFGRHLATVLGHDADRLRSQLQRNRDDLGVEAHLEIESRRQLLAQAPHVVVLDVTAVLAQVHGDAVRAGFLGPQGPFDGIGKGLAARLAQRGDVVDVDVEARHRGEAHPNGSKPSFLRSPSAQLARQATLRRVRIIAGELGGRRIEAPEGDATRPMLDRVREALFSRIEDLLPGARVLDLFAGSGSLGLEALSRGALHVRFVERDAEALASLDRNVRELGVKDRVRVWRGDALRFESWRDRRKDEPVFDLAFFDPPYKLVTNPDTSPMLVRALEVLVRDNLSPDGLVVVHGPTRDIGPLRPGPDWGFDLREYGGSAIALLTGPRPA